ncbi:hypothetical protein TWF281_005470 [Arthrobotrys megalospora]
MSSRFGSGIYQDDSLPEQPFSYWPQQTQYWPPRPLLFDPAPGNNLNLGERVSTSVYPLYSHQNQYFMPPEIPTNDPPRDIGLGSQSNPIILGSDDSDVIYQGEAPLAAHNNVWTSGPIYTYNERKPRCRKRKLEALEEAEDGFFTVPAPGGRAAPANNYYQESRGVYTPNLPTLGSHDDITSKFIDTADPQTGIWNKNFLNPSQIQPANNISDSTLGTTFEDITSLDKSTIHASPSARAGERPLVNMVDLTYESMHSNPTPSHSRGKRRASTFLSSAVPEDLEKVQAFFAEFLDEGRSTGLPCPHGSSALSSIFSAIKSDDRKKGGSLPYNHDGKTCFFRCSDCKTTVCAGCGEKVGKVKVPFNNLLHSCIDSHFLSIILVLAKIDARWHLKEFGSSSLVNQRKPGVSVSATVTASSIQQTALPSPRSVSSSAAMLASSRAGVGYGTGHVSGGKKAASGGRKVAKTATKLKQESEDNRCFTELLAHLVALMKDEEEEFSMISLIAERADLLTSFIRVSYLPDLIGSLVRNDSIMDIDACNTWDMYAGCLELLRIFSIHEPLLEVLVTTLQEKKSSPGIASLVKLPEFSPLKGFIPNKKRAGVLATLDPVEFVLVEGFDGIGQPIIHSLQRLVKQCQAFMNNASRVATDDEDEETNRLLAFCIDVDATAIELNRQAEELQKKKDRARPSTGLKNSHLASLPPNILAHPIFSSTRGSSISATPRNPLDIPLDVRQECKQALLGHLQFKFSTAVIATHSGANLHNDFNANHANNSSAAPGRMKRLIKELTVLSTTLPPGIYVRVQEDRPDTFKAIIVGPESSPYHLGLYEFDFTIPNNYPNVPPLVTFRTTGGGRVRFNPNLYEAGKVCLSILGTWSGSASEQWQPKTSTLLQVLVSIQSMILCAEPYYNEPGYEQHPDARASRAYNENVQLNSIRLAMNDWLSYTGLWDDVIQAHFLAHTPEILSTTRNFASKGSSDTPAPYAIADLQAASFMQPFGNPMAPPALAHPSMQNAMQKARQDLEDAMKSKLPGFLKASLWKESTE